MSPKRILFVDDEPNVLEGLQNVFRRQRRGWDMTFAVGGEAALLELERAPFDVIVCDMRMPGMDGAALLERVKGRFPAVARIVLSGRADREAVIRSLPVVHQFLSKPCDGDALHAVIERTCQLQALLSDGSLRTIVGRLDALPSVPQTYLALTAAVARENVGPAELAAIVESDPAMTVKVLQLVNSAYFGLAHSVTSIQQAVTYLGVDLLKGLVLTAHVFAAMVSTPARGLSLDELREHSLRIARLAKRLVDDPRVAQEAFTAAIVHDIGKIVLACGLPGPFATVMSVMGTSKKPVHEIEREILGTTHAEVGAYLLGVWGLPFTIVEAVAYHHMPAMVPTGARDVLMTVHVADALVRGGDATVDVAFLESLGMADRLPRWREIAADHLLPAA
jgi:HD-like signal output (HDOD) protein